MTEPADLRRFKQDLRDAARAARFESLRDIEIKTGLSRATVSAAFSTTQPLPTERTVHAIASAIGADASAWTARLRDHLRDADPPPDRLNPGLDPAEAQPEVTVETDREPAPGAVGVSDAQEGGTPGHDNVQGAAGEDADGDGQPDEPASVANERDPNSGRLPHRRRWRWLAAAAVGAVLTAAGFGAGYLVKGLADPAQPGAASPPSDTTGSPVGGSPTGTPRSSTQPAARIAETVIPENAAPTFKDPLTVRGLGPKIPANTTVTVSCRLFSDAVPSAYPDGYWYRIETAPWSGEYYAAANTFLNGDPPGDPTKYKHPTDTAVPIC